MKRNRLPLALATLAVIAISAFAAWMTDGPRILTAACNAPNGNQFDLTISSFSVSPSLVVGTGTVVTFLGNVVSVPPGYYSGPANWSPYGATPSFTVPGTYTNIGSGTYTDTFGHVCHSFSVTAEVDVVGFGLQPAYTGFWGIAGASVTVVVTGFVPRGVSWDISAPHGISVATTHMSATLTANGSGSGVVRLSATAIGATNNVPGGLVQGGKSSGSTTTATAWVLVTLGGNSSPTLICTNGIHPRHAVHVDGACYLHLWGSLPWHAVFDAGIPSWGTIDHTTSGSDDMFLRGRGTGCFVQDEESLKFTFPPLTDATITNFFTVLDLNTFTASVCDQTATTDHFRNDGRLRIARNVGPIDLVLNTMPSFYVVTDNLLLWEFVRDNQQIALGPFDQLFLPDRKASYQPCPEALEPGINYALNAWFDCDNANGNAGVRADDETTFHVHVNVMNLDISGTDMSGYTGDPDLPDDGWGQQWAILGESPGFTTLHIADPGVYEGTLSVSWLNSPTASMGVSDCSEPYTMTVAGQNVTVSFNLAIGNLTWPIDIGVTGRMDACKNMLVTLRNDIYCGYDEISLVPCSFNISAREREHTVPFEEHEVTLCIPTDGDRPILDFKLDFYGEQVRQEDVQWDIVLPNGDSAATFWTGQQGTFAVNPTNSTGERTPGEYRLRAWLNCTGGTPGVDPGETVRVMKVFVANTEVWLHPKAGDFAAGKAGRVMISAALDHVYHTTGTTAKDNKVAQTEDGKVKITARLSPGCQTGKTVYFRVVDPDPDDLSSYETDTTTGDNKATTDKPGHLSAPNAIAERILGTQTALAEVELTITDQYAGDNYKVECSLDNFVTVAGDTTTLVAWKRVYYKHHKMWKVSSDLTSNFLSGPSPSPPSPPSPSDIWVADGAKFNVGDTVKVFDSGNTNGEDVTVLATNGNKLTVTTLTNDYWFGYPETGQPITGNGAAVARLNQGWWEAPAITNHLTTDCFGGVTSGSDGGCFVEFTEIGGGSVVPFRDQWTDPDPTISFPKKWFKSVPPVPHLIHVLSGYWRAGNKLGSSDRANHQIHLWCKELTDIADFPTPIDQTNASAKVFCHELMHVLSGHTDCSHNMAHDNMTGKPCVLFSPADPPQWKNNHAEGYLDHINAVRDQTDDF